MQLSTDSKGNLLAILSFVYWGIAPIYWQIFAYTSPFIVVFNRFIWGAAILLIYMALTKKLGLFLKLLTLRVMALLCLQALLLMANWIIFAYSFVVNQTVQAGLGYAMNPLLNIVIALLVFKERLRRLDAIALIVAVIAILYLLAVARVVPTIALVLCSTFAVYGALKKNTRLPSYFTLGVEMLFASLISGVFLLAHAVRPIALFSGKPLPLLIFVSAGLATIIPLLLYITAVKLIPFARVAFFQFLVPTLITLVSLTVLDENIPLVQLPGYGLMWCALMIYIVSLLKNQKTAALAKNKNTE